MLNKDRKYMPYFKIYEIINANILKFRNTNLCTKSLGRETHYIGINK